MHVEFVRNVTVDASQKLQKLNTPVLAVALANDFSRSNIKRRKERRGSMAQIGWGSAFWSIHSHRYNRLTPLEGLNLRLFVDTACPELAGIAPPHGQAGSGTTQQRHELFR